MPKNQNEAYHEAVEPSNDDSVKTPFYQTYDGTRPSDMEVLPLYAIYRRVSGGQTLEPYETLLREHPEVENDYYNDEQAA